MPLYAPFHLAQTVPAMLGTHLLVAGFVEAALTIGVVAYLQRANLPVLRINHPDVAEDDGAVAVLRQAPAAPDGRPRWAWAAVGIATMVILTPLGLLASGTAFGEDPPEGSGFWHHALFNGYDFTGGQHPNVGYVVSALVGTLVIAGSVLITFRLVQVLRRSRREAAQA